MSQLFISWYKQFRVVLSFDLLIWRLKLTMLVFWRIYCSDNTYEAFSLILRFPQFLSFQSVITGCTYPNYHSICKFWWAWNPWYRCNSPVFNTIEWLTVSLSVIGSSNDVLLISGTKCIAGWNFGLFSSFLMTGWSFVAYIWGKHNETDHTDDVSVK